jgi:hypothetical protein
MKSLPSWKALGVDLVIDCTGRATTRSGAQAHLDAGANRVLLSAPSKTREDCDAVLLPGINLDTFDPERHKIVSMARAACRPPGITHGPSSQRQDVFSSKSVSSTACDSKQPTKGSRPHCLRGFPQRAPDFLRKKARVTCRGRHAVYTAPGSLPGDAILL